MKKKPKHILVLLASTASKDELRRFQEARAKMLEDMKPLLDQHRAADAEVEAYRIATDVESKTLAEITAYLALNPLSPIAQAIASLEVNNSSKFRKGKLKGSMSKRNKFIHKLATDNPEISGLNLYLSVEGKDPLIPKKGYLVSTFEKEVSKARNPKN
jgi:hypothetical protein